MRTKTTLFYLMIIALGFGTMAQAQVPDKVAIIKADDIRSPTVAWDLFFALSEEKGVKVSAGIICNSLEGNQPAYFNWLTTLQASGQVEFWHHGYDHSRGSTDSQDWWEFKNTGYDAQKSHFDQARTLMLEVLGVAPVAFGAPYNQIDADTTRVLDETPEMRLVFAYASTHIGQQIFAPMTLRGEHDGTGKPNAQSFIDDYHAKDNVSFTAIQFHPNNFTNAQLAEYGKILDFLIAEGWTFVLPGEYVEQSTTSTTYALSVNQGSGGGNYWQDQEVLVLADTPPEGYRFVNWSSPDGGTFTDANAASTTYTMPGNDTVITANYGPNNPPSVNAGANQTVSMSENALPWTPAGITGTAWYDASDPASITHSGGAVAQWSDKSGNGQHLTQGTAANRPATGTQTINGINVIDFDGVNDRLGDSNFSAQDADITVSAVLQPLDPATNISYTVPLEMVYNGSANRLDIQFKGSTGTNKWYNDEGGGYMGAFTAAADEHYICTMENSASITKHFKNGTAVGNDGTHDYTSVSQFFVGARPDGNNASVCRMGEVVVHSVDTATRQQVEGYLAHKWGLESELPADHPYKAAAPTMSTATVNLNGTVSDPDNDPLTTTWSLASGPGAVSFGDSTALNTTATFSESGSYILRLTADDGYANSTGDMVEITVQTGTDPFENWAASWEGEVVTLEGDVNRDGLADGLAWLLGATDPATKATTLIPAVHPNSGGDLLLDYSMRKPSLRGTALLQLQHSSNLSDWITVTVPDASSTMDGIEFTITPSANPEVNQVQAAIPAPTIGEGRQYFIRLSSELE